MESSRSFREAVGNSTVDVLVFTSMRCSRPPSRFPDAITHRDPGTIARSSGLAHTADELDFANRCAGRRADGSVTWFRPGGRRGDGARGWVIQPTRVGRWSRTHGNRARTGQRLQGARTRPLHVLLSSRIAERRLRKRKGAERGAQRRN